MAKKISNRNFSISETYIFGNLMKSQHSDPTSYDHPEWSTIPQTVGGKYFIENGINNIDEFGEKGSEYPFSRKIGETITFFVENEAGGSDYIGSITIMQPKKKKEGEKGNNSEQKYVRMEDNPLATAQIAQAQQMQNEYIASLKTQLANSESIISSYRKKLSDKQKEFNDLKEKAFRDEMDWKIKENQMTLVIETFKANKGGGMGDNLQSLFNSPLGNVLANLAQAHLMPQGATMPPSTPQTPGALMDGQQSSGYQYKPEIK